MLECDIFAPISAELSEARAVGIPRATYALIDRGCKLACAGRDGKEQQGHFHKLYARPQSLFRVLIVERVLDGLRGFQDFLLCQPL